MHSVNALVSLMNKGRWRHMVVFFLIIQSKLQCYCFGFSLQNLAFWTRSCVYIERKLCVQVCKCLQTELSWNRTVKTSTICIQHIMEWEWNLGKDIMCALDTECLLLLSLQILQIMNKQRQSFLFLGTH